MRRITSVLVVLVYSLTISAPCAGAAEMRYTMVDGADGVPLLVAEAGNPDGAPILFLHGMSQSHLAFQAQFNSDLAKNHRLIAFDLRGHGGSGKPWQARDYSAKRKVWAKDVAAVIKAKNLDDVTLAAWSFGGYVAMAYVKEYGTSKLKAINLAGTPAGLVSFERTPADQETMAQIMQGSKQRSSLDLAENIAGFSSVATSFTAKPMPETAKTVAVATALMQPAYVRRAFKDLPLSHPGLEKAIDVPVLVTVGTEDLQLPLEAAQRLAGMLPRAAVSIYDDVGHFASLEASERFNCELSLLAGGEGVCETLTAFPVPPTAAQMRARYGAPPSKFISVDGVNMHLRDEGNPKGPALIFLPGHMGSLHMYDLWVPHLIADYRVIQLDWPPYGLSLPDPSGVYSSPRAAELVIQFMEQQNIEQATIIGTSNGATVAAHVAAFRPDLVERLALSTFPLGRPPKREISPDLMREGARHARNQSYRPASFFKAVLESIFADPANVTPQRIAQYTDMNNHPGGYQAQRIYIDNNLAMYDKGDLPPLYAKITAPTLLQWGDGGVVLPAYTAQASVDVLSNAPVVLRRYPKAGHMPMIERPEETVEDLRAFLAGELDDQARAPGR